MITRLVPLRFLLHPPLKGLQNLHLEIQIAGTAQYSIHVGREGGLLNYKLLVILVGDERRNLLQNTNNVQILLVHFCKL